MDKNILKNFSRYVSLSVLGMMGFSFYVLGDTFLVSKALGGIGLAALNISISIYTIVHGIGLMIGMGGATRYSILKSQKKDEKANRIFSIAATISLILGLIFLLIGVLGNRPLASILGADSETMPLVTSYLRTVLIFSPFFLINNTVLAFVRNDNAPRLAMIAMLVGYISNVILDYIFMFPLNMGMFGVAFATSLSPVISLMVLLIHFISKSNRFRFIKLELKLKAIRDIISLGLSAFINEASSAIVLITFNLIILNIAGNVGVASYGIIANLSLIAIAILTGVSQGVQPLISKAHGLRDNHMVRKVLKYGLITSLGLSLLIYLGVYLQAEGLVRIFNSENNAQITSIATIGLRVYFLGMIFAGTNILISSILSAMESPRKAFIISIGRGFVVIIPAVILLSSILELTGVWLSFVFTELMVFVISLIILKKVRNKTK